MPPTSSPYMHIAIRPSPVQGIRYMSGFAVYDEALADGHLVGRYWSPSGQVWPEMHLPPELLQAALRQGPLAVFRLGIEGQELEDGWSWQDAGEQADDSHLHAGPAGARQVVIALRHAQRPIALRVCTRLDGSDWLVRWLEITNDGPQPTAISSLAVMSGRLWAHRYDEHLPPALSTPFELAYNHSTQWGMEGDLWWEPLPSGVKAFDGGCNGKSGWSRPAFWVRDLANGQTFVCELAWSGNWRFELRCQLDQVRKQASLYFAMGLASLPGEMLRLLAPGETVRTPAVHIGCFQRPADAIVQSLHRHVRHTVMLVAPRGHEVEIEANHRGYLCDRENEPGLVRDIDVAAEIGAEMYVVDAGWFGREPNRWWLNVGDWHAGPWLPGGLEPVVAHAHRKGLRFGLWVEVEAAGASSRLRQEHPDWLITRHGQLVADGRALDLARPEVAAWVEAEIARLIERYKLDMFRLDHNHSIGLGGTCERDGFTENTLWRYYEALYGIFDRLRARFPEVVLQNCAGGGGRLDLGILQRFHCTELSDWMRQPRAAAIFNGLTMSLPPEIGLRTFGTESPEHALDADLDSQLRYACLCRPIFRGIAPSVEDLNPLLKERIVHHLDLYRRSLRPLMVDCLVFHHTPWLPTTTPAPWFVLEYASPDARRAAVALFRLREGGDPVFRLHPRGLDRGARYRLTYDNSGQAVELSGWQLMNEGLAIALPLPFTSELLLLEAIG